MIGNIYTIFPTGIMTFALGREFTKDEMGFVDLCREKSGINISNRLSVDHDVLDREPMLQIKRFAEEGINDYLKEMYRPDTGVDAYITQSWLNYTGADEYHHLHTHGNSFLSGVIYFKANPNVDRIQFVRMGHQQLKLYSKNPSAYVADAYDLAVAPGMLAVFPSHLSHTVSKLTSDRTDERVSLAFNTFLRGRLGSENALTRLVL